MQPYTAEDCLVSLIHQLESAYSAFNYAATPAEVDDAIYYICYLERQIEVILEANPDIRIDFLSLTAF